MIDKFENMTDDPAWDRTVMSVYGVEPRFIENDRDRIKLFFSKPRFGRGYMATAPYADYGGVSVAGDRVADETVAGLNALLRESRARYLLVRTHQPVFEGLPGFVTDTSHFTFKLDLRPGPEEIWTRGIGANKRSHVRRARKKGLTIQEGGIELLDDFYRVIAACWRDLGTPTHGKRFFRELIANFGTRIAVIVIRDGQVPVSAALVYLLERTISDFPFTLNSYKKHYVNELLYWTIIELACARGKAFFNMGRSHIDQGTYPYKESWGGRPVQIYNVHLLARGVKPIDIHSPFLKLATSAWKLAPVRITTALGPSLIRKIL